MRQQKLGSVLCLGLVLALSACRKDPPPKIDVCLHDGMGGGDCALKDGTRAYRVPSELTNYWMTSQEDMRAFTTWCYGAKSSAEKAHVDAELSRLKYLALWGEN